MVALNFFPGLAVPLALRLRADDPPPNYDAAMPPVSVDHCKRCWNAIWLPRGRATARLRPARMPASPSACWSMATGESSPTARRRPDSIFEIGSITKTFTGLVLARMVEQGKVRLDEPVRELLPPGTVAKPPGREITLLDLATQHSGLPQMPDNFNPVDAQ